MPEPDGSALSPVTAAVYLFLTMIIVLQVTAPAVLASSLAGGRPRVPPTRLVPTGFSWAAFPPTLPFASDAEAEGLVSIISIILLFFHLIPSKKNFFILEKC